MKILFAHDAPIIKNAVDSKYYTTTFSYDLWKRYLNFGNELIVASRNQHKEIINTENYLISSGPNVSFLEIPSLSNIRNRAKNKRIAKDKLKKILLTVDAVIVRLPSEIGLLAYEISLEQSKPVFIEMVGCPEDSYKFHGSILGKLYSPFAKLKYKKTLNKAPFVLYVTKNYLQSKYPTIGKSDYASNVELSPLNTQIVLANRLNHIIKDQRPIRIGLIGSLNVKYKGIETAMHAMKMLSNKHDVILEIVGGGDSKFWQKVSEKLNVKSIVKYKGKFTSDQVLNWLDTIDIYIQPSKTEGLPRALIEAMSRGCPSIASRVGGIPELLSNEFMHEPGDSRALFEKLSQLIKDDNKKNIAARDNIDKASDYTRNKIVFRRNKIYEEFFNSIEVKNKS